MWGGGRTVRDLLSRPSIFGGEGCGRPNCGACSSAAKPVNCRKRGILYQTSCEECKVDGREQAVYVGESARSGFERMGEHWADAVCGRKDSHIHKHWVNRHGGRQTMFSFEILNFFSSALERQVGEAVRILMTGAERILNSKGEYSRCNLVRITTKDAVEEQTLGDRGPDDDDHGDDDEGDF